MIARNISLKSQKNLLDVEEQDLHLALKMKE